MITIRPYEYEMFDEVLEFCKREANDDPASSNMWTSEWIYAPTTLPFILKNTSRFKKTNGIFHLILDDEKIIGCGGVYKARFDELVAFAGSRAWLNKNYRSQQIIRNVLLPEQKRWALQHDVKNIALSFNEYNKNLATIFQRGQRYRTRNPDHLFYSNFKAIEHLVLIQEVPQWVIVEEFDGYQFDWSSLKPKG